MPPVPRLHRPVLTAILAALHSIFHDGAPAEQAVESLLQNSPKWGSRDRQAFAESVYELVRWWRREACRAGVPDEEIIGPSLSADACALIWAAWWTAQGRPLPDFSGIDPAAVSPEDGGRRLASATAAVRASLPDWLDATGASAMEDAWPALRDALNEPAIVWLRANTLRATPDKVVGALAREGVSAIAAPGPHHPDAVRLGVRRNLKASPALRAGLFEIQDAGSQQIAPFLHARPGEVVVDSCAGAGGKALHLAALMRNTGRIIALDVRPWKLDTLRRRAARAGATGIECVPLTASGVPASLAGVADRLLIDAPCSGLGVLRRHPDTKWKLSPAELERLVLLQAEILDTHSRLLKPGGTLVYATCSFLPQENSRQVRAFLERQPPGDWSLEEERLILPNPADPHANHDAYYIARLRSQPLRACGQ